MTKEMDDAKPEVESPETRLKMIADDLDKLIEGFDSLNDKNTDLCQFIFRFGMIMGSLPLMSSLAKGEMNPLSYELAKGVMSMTNFGMYIRNKAENDEEFMKEIDKLKKKNNKEMRKEAKKMKKEIKEEMKEDGKDGQ